MQGTLKVTKNMLKEITAHFLGTAINSRLSELFPEYCGTKKQLKLTAEAFTTPARKKVQLPQATVTVASPNSVKTGQHYDMGVFDDLIHDQNWNSQTKLQQAEDDFNGCQPLIDPGCYRLVSGTRYTFGDLYENIMRKNDGSWKVSLKTCWTDDGTEVRFPQTKTKDGRFIGLTREMLMQIAKDTPSLFSSQYLNQPIMEGTQLFTEEKMLGAVVSDKDSPALSQAVLFVDLATEGPNCDDSVVLAGKVDASGRMYAVDFRGRPVVSLCISSEHY